MTKLILAAGVAALAITSPAASQPGEKRGKDRGAQAQKDQKAERGGKVRAQRTERRQAVRERANVREQRAQRVDRAREQRAERLDRVQELRGRAADRREMVEQRVTDRSDRGVLRAAERRDRQLVRVSDRRDDRIERIAQRLERRDVLRARDWDDLVRGGIWVNGCPPGLAKKPVPCVPPGQVRNLVGQPLTVLRDRVTLRELPDRLRVVYVDTPEYYYRYGNGYVYRVNRQNDLISALLPLFGLGLTAGQPFPAAYSNYYLPTGLQAFYPSTSQDYYRYANGYVYEIDGRTGLIEDVDPLLGYGYGYGQMMPATYSAYNVPYQYRPLYADTSSYYYRYAPGAIYQVDPTTSLITAVAALLTGGMTVGQPMPMGYSTYNVPLAYRANYYDTPDAWYRYSNGYIYRVDPATQLVSAIVASVLT
jgi:hypothetical protein